LTPNSDRDYQSSMTNLKDLTTSQLSRIIALKEEIEALQSQIDSLVAGGEALGPIARRGPKKRRVSSAARNKIAAAQKARWAKVRAGQAGVANAAKTPKKRGKMSAAGRAKIAAAAKARWAKAKAAGKTRL
jgi:hypothetical protein